VVSSASAAKRRSATRSSAKAIDDILAALRAYDAATRAGDIEGQVAFFADSWRSSSGTTKADLREYLRKQVDRPADREKRFVLDDAEVVFDGDIATVDPVALRSPTGGGFFEFRMTRESDGAWRCVSVAGSRRARARTCSIGATTPPACSTACTAATAS